MILESSLRSKRKSSKVLDINSFGMIILFYLVQSIKSDNAVNRLNVNKPFYVLAWHAYDTKIHKA